jgi:acyl carrier protein
MEIEAEIRSFVARNLLFSDGAYSYPDDTSFLREGIIDSLGVLELVTFAGGKFGINVEPTDVTPDNFDSVNRLAAYIRRKQNAEAANTGEQACVGS